MGFYFPKHQDFVSTVLKGAAAMAEVGAGAAAVAGTGAALVGGDTSFARFGGWSTAAIASGLASMSHYVKTIDAVENVNDDHRTVDKTSTALIAAELLTAAGPCGAMSARISAGTHKLTTSIINQLEPEQQVERTVKPEPAPIFDEFQLQDV